MGTLSLFGKGLTPVAACDYVMLWILYCEETIISCDNYGEAMSFAPTFQKI